VEKIQHPGTVRLRNSSTNGDQTGGSTATKTVTVLVGLVDGPGGACPDGTAESVTVALAVSASDGGDPPAVSSPSQPVTAVAGSTARVKFGVTTTPTSCMQGEGPVPKSLGGTNELSRLTYQATATISAPEPVSGSGSSEGNLLCKPSRSGTPAPSVAITSPFDGAVTNGTPAPILGTQTDAAQVTVNGFPATVGDGTFFATIPLLEGANRVTAVATNGAGSARDSITLVFTTGLTNVVWGVISDAVSGATLEGALVEVASNDEVFSAASDAEGRYSLAGITPGALTITISLADFETQVFTADGDPPGVFRLDVQLDEGAVPANEVTILVPPDGTVTDLDLVTVVGRVLHPTSSVTVNGIAAEVIGRRFTARSVSLTTGSNTLEAIATAPGVASVTDSVEIERADQPVLAVTIFSPPSGAALPGSGLVVRGFVSGRNTRTVVTGGFVPVNEGIFQLNDLALPAGEVQITAITKTLEGGETARDDVLVQVASDRSAVLLEADPVDGVTPLDVRLEAVLGVPLFEIERVDFDADGNGVLDDTDSQEFITHVTFAEPRPRRPRVFLTTPQGVELSGSTTVSPHLPDERRAGFAHGNPVDLAPAPGGGIWVLDAAAGTVSRYGRDGDLLQSFGSSGAGPDQLLNPQALTVGPNQHIYVADTGNDRIQVFLPDGTLERTIGQSGAALGSLLAPHGVAVDGSLLLVAEDGNSRVQLFGLEGGSQGALPLTQPRGLAPAPGFGVLASSPSDGVRAIFAFSLGIPGAISDLPPAGQLVGPVDVAAGSDGILIADSDRQQVVLLDNKLGFRRVVDGLDLPPRGVLPGTRGEVESIYVADGTEVVEIALPAESPLPVVETLRARLAAGDIEGALSLIDPIQRDRYREIYELIQDDLPEEAAAMSDVIIRRIREDRAVLVIRRAETSGSGTVIRHYPVTFVRAEDGTWQILDY
jgi:hypothetical protein